MAKDNTAVGGEVKKSKAQRVAEEWAADAEEVREGTRVFKCPLYTVAVQNSSSTVLVGGGGGRTKSGIPNGFKLFRWETEGKKLKEIGHCDTGALLVASAAMHPKNRLVACSTEAECRLYQWSAAEKNGRVSVKEVATVRTEGEEKDQKTVAFSPCGELLATAGEGGVVKLWNVEEILRKESNATVRHEHSLGCAVNSLSFSVDGSLLLATSLERLAAVFEVEGLRLLRKISPADCSPPRAFMRGGCFIGPNALVCQGKARAGSHVVLWPTGEEKGPIYTSRMPGPHHHTALASYAREEGESALVACAMGEGDIAVVESGGGRSSQVMYRTAVHSFIAPALAFTPDGSAVISVSLDRTCVVTLVRKDKRLVVVGLVLATMLLIILLAFLGYL